MNLFLFLLFLKPFIYERIYISAHIFWSILAIIYLLWFAVQNRTARMNDTVFSRAVFLFTLCVAASALYTVFVIRNRYIDTMHLYTMIGGSVFALLALSNGAQQQRILAAIVAASAGISFIALYTLLVSSPITLEYLKTHRLRFYFVEEFLSRKRAFFPFVSPDTLGGFLTLSIFPTLYFLKRNKWYCIALLVQCAALLLTKSVGVFFSFLAGALLYYWGSSPRLRKRHVIISTALCALMATLFILFRQGQEKAVHLSPLFSLKNRIDYISQGLRLLKEHPVWGSGMGSFHIYSGTKYVHNLFVQLWAEAGIFTVASLLGVILITLRRGCKSLRRVQNEEKTLVLGVFCSFCAFLIHNLVDFDFFIFQASYAWWVYAGLIHYNYIRSSEDR